MELGGLQTLPRVEACHLPLHIAFLGSTRLSVSTGPCHDPSYQQQQSSRPHIGLQVTGCPSDPGCGNSRRASRTQRDSSDLCRLAVIHLAG